MRGRSGFTMTEMMMAMAVMVILVAAITPLLMVSRRAFTSAEARAALISESPKTLNRLGVRLSESKRVFEGTAADAPFLSRVQLGSGPAALNGSLLPVKEETGSLSPSTSAFSSSSVGNSLFFAAYESPFDAVVADAASSTHSVRVDLYRFHYYYLYQGDGYGIGGRPRRRLREWHSAAYADYGQLTGITDATQRSNTVTALVNAGTLYAYDPSQTDPSLAFYDLDAGGGISADASHGIPESDSDDMIRILTGITGSGYRYGVCPNTGGSFTPSVTVPAFGTANGDFPSGFEISVVGAASARRVFIRLVMAAEGSFKGTLTHEQTTLAVARDVW